MAILMENYVPGTPEIPAGDLKEAFLGMTDYIFVTNEPDGSKTFLCSRCGEKYNLRFPARTYTNAEEDLFRAKHREYGTCAKCGFNAWIINTGRKKRLSDLREEKAAAFVLPVSENEVCIRCEFFYRDFAHGVACSWRESYELYRFRKGEEPEYYRARYYYGDVIRVNKLREPFGRSNSAYGFTYADYRFIGLNRLENTFFKYSLFRKAGYREVNDGFLYLALYSRYPEKVEMLLKGGYAELLSRKLNGYKTRHAVKWNAESLRDFWKLSKVERNEWARFKNDMDVLDVYMRLFRGRKNGMVNAKNWNVHVSYYISADVTKYLDRYGAAYEDFLRYLKKQAVLPGSAYTWKDYIEAAEAIGFDLTVHNVLFPKELVTAHDETVKIRKLKALEIEQKKAAERFDKLMKLYGMEKDGYFIRAPHDCAEIIDEGKALKHCVGGYAARHANGVTTILFMRSAAWPDKPLYTIEMHGKELIQVHGFHNRTAPKDIPAANEFFESWLKWVKGGSKRPKAHKKDKEAERTISA